MSALPLVSVAIGVYNPGPVLAEALDSVLAQTYPNLEIIVVDDGSTDGTAQVLERYAGRVIVISQPNGGVASARNAGIARARGELVALMDQDDRCRPERIAVQVAAMALHPEAVVCATDFSAFNAQGPVSASHGEIYYSAIRKAPKHLASLYPQAFQVRLDADPARGLPRDEAFEVLYGSVYPAIAFGSFLHPPTVMFRRKAAAAIAGLDGTLRFNCDWEWLVRMARTGPFLHVCKALLEYRISSTQLSGPRRGAEEIVLVSKMMAAYDPELAVRHAGPFRDAMRQHHFDAAYHFSQTSRLRAAGHWVQAVRHGELSTRALRLAARILVPTALHFLVRAWRKPRR